MGSLCTKRKKPARSRTSSKTRKENMKITVTVDFSVEVPDDVDRKTFNSATMSIPINDCSVNGLYLTEPVKRISPTITDYSTVGVDASQNR